MPAPKKDGEDQAIGRSKGGLSTKIHALVDALGNPLAFFLTPGQAHDLEGADALLPQMQADTLLADKAFDADERVIEPLLAAGKTLVIPPKSNRKVQRAFDKEMYKARHLIENFFCKLKQYRAIATRYDKTARNFLAGNPPGRRYHLAQLRTGPSFLTKLQSVPDLLSKAKTRHGHRLPRGIRTNRQHCQSSIVEVRHVEGQRVGSPTLQGGKEINPEGREPSALLPGRRYFRSRQISAGVSSCVRGLA